jgi:hypothetical protein
MNQDIGQTLLNSPTFCDFREEDCLNLAENRSKEPENRRTLGFSTASERLSHKEPPPALQKKAGLFQSSSRARLLHRSSCLGKNVLATPRLIGLYIRGILFFSLTLAALRGRWHWISRIVRCISFWQSSFFRTGAGKLSFSSDKPFPCATEAICKERSKRTC